MFVVVVVDHLCWFESSGTLGSFGKWSRYKNGNERRTNAAERGTWNMEQTLIEGEVNDNITSSSSPQFS